MRVGIITPVPLLTYCSKVRIQYILPSLLKTSETYYNFYKSRPLPEDAKITVGSFNEDSRGRWYINISFKIPKIVTVNQNTKIGIDLGVKDSLTLSDGQVFSTPHYKELKNKLSTAQRSKKKKQVLLSLPILEVLF